MAVSATQLYWAVVDPNNEAAWVYAAGLDGSGANAIVSSDDATGVAVDSSHLYWADAHDGTIGEANLNGSGAHTIITGQDTPQGVAVG